MARSGPSRRRARRWWRTITPSRWCPAASRIVS